MDKKHVTAAFGYAILGLVLGIYMASSHDHGQLVTHAHILLLGFVTSFIFGVCHKIWIGNANKKLATIQFVTHQAGTAVMVVGLFLLYGQYLPEKVVGPVVGLGSVSVLASMVLMKTLFIKATATRPEAVPTPTAI